MTLSTINRNSVEKCVESGTTAGAEYAKASNAVTKKSFTFQINMVKCQMNACSYWLELLVETSRDKKLELEKLFQDAKDLAQIFNKISWTLSRNREEETAE